VQDRIGNFTFIRLSSPPQRAMQQWDELARTGVDGTALWSTGKRGERFSVESLAVAYTFEEARTFYPNYLLLVDAAPVLVHFGTLELNQSYKVLQVELLECKRVVKALVARQPTPFGAIVRARWELLPIDPEVQKP
jgi:hypothetical protein